LPALTSSATFFSTFGTSSKVLSSSSLTAGSISVLPFDQFLVESLFVSRKDQIAASVVYLPFCHSESSTSGNLDKLIESLRRAGRASLFSIYLSYFIVYLS
jgi:hypothetical protein